MNKKFWMTAIALAAAVAVCGWIGIRGEEVRAETASAGEIVMEAESGRVLYERNSHVQLPMASTTKILTALIIIEDCNLDDMVTVPKEAVGVEGSNVYLQSGEKMSVKNLLYGLMLRSGNDCAEALAIYHSGSVPAFAECMNERAAGYGARNSHFANPHGLPAEGHYTTAFDLSLIACRAIRNDVFREIVSTKSVTVPDGGCGYARTFVNKNKMLFQYFGANGIKTGYTKAAGRCLVTSAEREGMQLVSVVLDSPRMYERSAEILDNCFSSYNYKKVFDSEEFVCTIRTDVKGKFCNAKVGQDFCYPLKEKEIGDISYKIDCPEKIRLPVYKGDEVGNLEIYLKNQLIFSQKIYSINTVKKSYSDIIREIAEKCVYTRDYADQQISGGERGGKPTGLR